MYPLSEGFLLTTAQIAATLIGLLLIGVLFFAETGLPRLRGRGFEGAAPYLQASTQAVVVMYALVLGVSLALISFEPVWVAPLFGVFSAAAVVALVVFSRRALAVSKVRPDWVHWSNAWIPWPPMVVMLALPWVLGGFPPHPEAYVVTILLAGAMAFGSTVSMVMFTFELAMPGEPEER